MRKIKDKKAISEMVSYVLLIVIAIGLSVGVYAWLRWQANIEKIEACPEDVSLVLKEYKCLYTGKIQVTVKNNGLFNVNGYVIRGTNSSDKNALIGFPLKDVNLNYGSNVAGAVYFNNSLAPGKEITGELSYSGLNKLTRVEIEPFRIQPGGLKLCNNAIVHQEVSCP